MKKFSVLLLTAAVAFAVGIISVCVWMFSPIPQTVKSPSELCLSGKFPGESFPVSRLSSSDCPDRTNLFFSASQEECFESKKFQDEKSYPEIAKADEIYRLVWLRTFHNPVIIRIYRMQDEKYIIAKQTDRRGGYDPGQLIFNKIRPLSDAEWCEFINLSERADIWNRKDPEILANDGAFWTIEAVREQRYYKSFEQSPKKGVFRDACIYLMRISGLNIDESSPEFY